MRPARLAALTLGVLLATAADPARPEGLEVTAGASVELGTGLLDLGCTDLDVAGSFAGNSGVVDAARDVSILPGGTLDLGSASLGVSGDWSNSGAFLAGSGSVAFVDGCGRSSATISGTNTFFDLEIASASGKAYSIQAGSNQKVQGALTLAGAPGSLLFLRSTLPGSEAYLAAEGSQSVAYVDVDDVHAVVNPIYYGSDSVVGPNTDGWLPLFSVPALGPQALLLTALLMAATAFVLRQRLSAHWA